MTETGPLLEQMLADAWRRTDPEAPLVEVLAADGGTARTFSYREIGAAADALAARLGLARLAVRAERGFEPLRVGVVMGNSPAFVAADLALLRSGSTEIPVPLAFSADQAVGLLETADVCLVDQAGRARLAEWGADTVLPAGCQVLDVDLDGLTEAPLTEAAAEPRDWICKVIHTSGTTSRPKGVRIRSAGAAALVTSLRAVMPAGAYRRYLSLVPFSLLIEQVTALYLVLCDGGTVVLLPESVPLVGTSAAAPELVRPLIAAARPTALVSTPALAETLASAADRYDTAEESVRALFGTEDVPLLSCGGAPVAREVLDRLEARGIRVYEGYGLSENSSVVCWNTPTARRLGTVGRPLPHVTVKLAEDRELLVRSSSLFAGYTRTDPSSCALDEDGWLKTGDLAEIDADGYVSIIGRKKAVIITASGRNVAPEWVEAAYATLPFVRAVAVAGDGLAALHGLFLIEPGTDPELARAEIAAFGERRLSTVERVHQMELHPADPDLYEQFFTVTGRPRRSVVHAALTAAA